jgi:hypothetical protein
VAISPEPDQLAPDGELLGVTVWIVVSLFVHTTVLLTPITTVTLAGLKPGAALCPLPDPFGMETIAIVDWACTANGATRTNPEKTIRKKQKTAVPTIDEVHRAIRIVGKF